MIKTKYDKNRAYDSMLSKLIVSIKDKITRKDDDFLVLAIGDTGSGKSMLMLHVYDEFAGDEACIDQVSFTKDGFADSLNLALRHDKGIRFVGNDEANVSKRDALSKFNKDLLDLYYSIRGLNIFHWWSNPSVDMIDKPFIKDRVKGLFLITTKSMDRPRVYYYFKKDKLLQVYEKYKNLDIKTLRSVRKRYSFYKGWFRDYNGRLKQAYLDKKNPRMVDKVKEFLNKYGTVKTNTGQKLYDKHYVAQMLQYSPSTVSTFLKTGVLERQVDVITSGNGTRNLITERGLLKMFIHKRGKGDGSCRLLDVDFCEYLEKRARELGML